MKRYAKYKDSGISWIGEVPEHWEVLKIRNLIKSPLQYGANESGVDYDVSKPRYIRITDITMENCLKDEGKLSLDKKVAEPYLLKDGDILFARSGASVGKTFLYQSEYGESAFAGYLIKASFDQSKMSPKYAFYNTLGNNYEEWKHRSFIQATIQNIGANRYNTYVIPVPPLSEQKAIADFLDKKTAQINELVAAKKKQIELLKEYKQAVIAKAVTQGINPKAKMKDSGIIWIGQIPEHWGVTRNKTFLLEKDDVVGKSNDYQLLSLTKGGVIIRDVESGKGKFPKDFESYKIVHSDDVVFCLFDVDETPRTVGLSKYNGMITGAYDIFQLQNINSEFYTYYFIAIDDRKALRPLYTGLRKVVKKDRFLSYKIAVPPLPEQEQIVAYIKEKVDSIDAQIASVEKQIANLNEFKQSLISDAVTGKIKVA